MCTNLNSTTRPFSNQNKSSDAHLSNFSLWSSQSMTASLLGKFFNNTNACKRTTHKSPSHRSKYMRIIWHRSKKISKQKILSKKLKKILPKLNYTFKRWKYHSKGNTTCRWIWNIFIDLCWWKRKSILVRKRCKITSICCSICLWSLTTLLSMEKFVRMKIPQGKKNNVSLKIV